MEQAADEGFDCSACQPYVVKPAGEGLGWGEHVGFGGTWGLSSLSAFPSAAPAPPPEIASVKAKEPGTCSAEIVAGVSAAGRAQCWPGTQRWLFSPVLAFLPIEPQYFRFEGVWLTETGMAVLRNLSLSPLHKRRQRKGRLGALNGDGGLEGGDPLGPDDKKDGDLDTDELLKAEGAFPWRAMERGGCNVGVPGDPANMSCLP